MFCIYSVERAYVHKVTPLVSWINQTNHWHPHWLLSPLHLRTGTLCSLLHFIMRNPDVHLGRQNVFRMNVFSCVWHCSWPPAPRADRGTMPQGKTFAPSLIFSLCSSVFLPSLPVCSSISLSSLYLTLHLQVFTLLHVSPLIFYLPISMCCLILLCPCFIYYV